VSCLPNARIVEVLDDTTYRGEIDVKVGPIRFAFSGIVQIESLDASTHTMVMIGEGKARRIPGRVKFAMTGTLHEEEETITRMSTSQEIHLAGKMVALGRGGVVQATADHMFDRFTRNLSTHLTGRS